MQYVGKFLAEFADVAKRLSEEDINKAVDLLFEAWSSGNKVFIIGNGGSASTATHFACDLAKTTSVEGRQRFKAISLTDNVPLLTALTNDEGFASIFVEQLKSLLEKGDVLIAISVHGGAGQERAGPWSQNLTAAIQYAKDNSARTIGIAGFDGGAFKKMTDVCIIVPANSTPYVESWHATLEHLMCSCLKERIQNT
ncbi:MAG TPA: SIS domain-containing protein [Candidatus Acidoferrum sp.]|nr:SIS domain-containing protein [Candidatus Acidoferrum sp.]